MKKKFEREKIRRRLMKIRGKTIQPVSQIQYTTLSLKI